MQSLFDTLAGAFATTTGGGVIAARLAIAAVLGALLGLDREWRNKPAGLKTHMLVALGAAVFAVLALELFETALRADGDARPDPVRIVEAMVKGAAFLGAGAILQARGGVEGLTTGASVWLAGAVGLSAGTGNFGIAVLATALGLGILVIIRHVEHKTLHPLRDRHGQRRNKDKDKDGDGNGKRGTDGDNDRGAAPPAAR
jgi:putative Mg2+ transporter-C (MgtC) family protein